MSGTEDRRPALALDAREHRLQAHLLELVSRTFALTIPRLPARLGDVIGNAYLLCRIIDTIEDELPIDAGEKDRLYARFVETLETLDTGRSLAADIARALPVDAPTGEIELIARMPEVLEITARLEPDTHAVVLRCVRVMASGMRHFEELGSSGAGLDDMLMMERYCYHVAGVVGEMLTELFCLHSDTTCARRERLMHLAVPFGNGLQLTNILKDMWLDHARGVCWLPRDLFGPPGTDLHALLDSALAGDPEATRIVDAATRRLVGRCRAYLDDAMRYVRTIPREEIGLRVFCLWSIGLAVLTLRKIRRDSVAARRHGTRITRSSVRATLAFSDASAGYAPVMRTLYAGACVGLPKAETGTL